MQDHYADLIKNVGEQIASAIPDNETGLVERARHLDGDVAELPRQIGQEVMILIYAVVGAELTEEDRAKGLTVQSRDVIAYHVIFGPIEVEFPYLWKSGQSSKPVKDHPGLAHQGRTETLDRALADFGAEESF